MAFDLNIPKKQTIALLGLAVRNSTTNIPTYSTALGDTSYATEELDRAGQSAASEVMKAICETDGHPHRALFTAPQSLTHASQLPGHFGSIGVPRITPFAAANYAIIGKRKSIEEISAYRHNPSHMYSPIDHDQPNGATHSKLAGFYAIDGETIYFTGFSAVSDIANFQESDYTLLPEMYYPIATDLQIAKLKKDGDLSDIFSYYEQQAMFGLKLIREKVMDHPSLKKTIGSRDSGQK